MRLRLPTSRLADKFVIRLPEGMRKGVEEFAIEHNSSMNSEIVLAIAKYLDNQARQELLINALQAQQIEAATAEQRAPAGHDEVVYLDGVKTPRTEPDEQPSTHRQS